MRCNQKFFGQEHFETGTPERQFCASLGVLKPAMSQYGFALKDQLPQLPPDISGLVEVKYNGMLTIVLWDAQRNGNVAWNPRGRCYYSLPTKKHPVTEYFNTHFRKHNLAFIGETHVVRTIDGKSYMTEFNRSMSIIKNPSSPTDVSRIRLAVFDYAERTGHEFQSSRQGYLDRFDHLTKQCDFPVGCDRGVVHLPDSLTVEDSFAESRRPLQTFWDEFVGARGFEGLVVHTENDEEYKIKFRDTLDAVIIAFRMTGKSRMSCESCGIGLDALWLRKLARDGTIERSEWFDPEGRLLKGDGGAWVRNDVTTCPVCGGSVVRGPGPILGSKIALMNPEGHFVDIADGAQFSPMSPILELVEPLYEANGYLWVQPKVVIEVAYQQLYVDRPRPVYKFENNRYIRVGTMNAISLRPYKPRLREDKTVNTRDLRLEQVSYFVNKVKSIQEKWRGISDRRSDLREYR